MPTLTNVVNNAPVVTGTSNQISVIKSGTTDTVALATPVTTSTQPVFMAYLSTTQSNVSGDGTTVQVVYDTALVNQGSNYNAGTGVFTVPITGNYIFTASNILMNTVLVTGYNAAVNTSASGVIYYTSVYAGTYPANSTRTTVGSIFLPLTSGTQVWMTITSSGAASMVTSILGSSSTVYTYFCGYLVL